MAIAALIEASLLTAVGWHGHWLAHPVKDQFLDDHFLEAQIFEVPKETHLRATTPVPPLPKPATEATVSKDPSKGKTSSTPPPAQEENQTHQGSALPANHGPVVTYNPAPQIPVYLRDRDLHAAAVIDFFVLKTGQTIVRLVGSSGNEELDALAITTAKTWKFLPAESNHAALDSKVRLRIVFKVE
jgi:TonB family protein